MYCKFQFSKSLLYSIVLLPILITTIYAQDNADLYRTLYEKAIPQKNGLIVVMKDNLYGAIDHHLKIVIPMEYDYLGDFYNTNAEIRKNHLIGMINENNKVIIPPIYDEITSFNDPKDYFKVKLNGHLGLIDQTGTIIFPVEYDEIGISYKDQLTGEELIPLNKDGNCGYANLKGEIVLPLIYEQCDFFSEGLAAVMMNNKRFYIDPNGTKVIEVSDKIDYVDGFSERRARVSSKDKNGYIDQSGTIVIPLLYSMAWPFNEGIALVQMQLGDKPIYACIDKNGNYIIKPSQKYENILFENNHTITVIKDLKYGLSDWKGTELFEAIFDELSLMDDGDYLGKTNQKYALYSPKGDLKRKLPYDHIFPFNDGIAIFLNKNKKMGYLNYNGTELLAARYDKAWNFSNGVAVVELNGKLGCIDTKGNMVIEAIYDEMDNEFHNGYINATIDNHLYLIDTKGIPFLELKSVNSK